MLNPLFVLVSEVQGQISLVNLHDKYNGQGHGHGQGQVRVKVYYKCKD